MLYLTCTTITSVDLAYYRVSRAKDWVSVDCGTSMKYLCTANGKSGLYCLNEILCRLIEINKLNNRYKKSFKQDMLLFNRDL